MRFHRRNLYHFTAFCVHNTGSQIALFLHGEEHFNTPKKVRRYYALLVLPLVVNEIVNHPLSSA